MMPAIVVDASVAIKWFVGEADSDAADRLLDQALELHAPVLLMTELANGLWKNRQSNHIDTEQAEASLKNIGRTIGHWHSMGPLLADALAMAIRLDHPIYDLLYIALAKKHAMQCVTADQRFIRKIQETEYADHLVHFAAWRPA